MSTARRSTADPRILERYIRSSILPRFVVRLREIEDERVVHAMRLARRYAEVKRSSAGDPGRFEERWRALARAWSFEHVNGLIAQHNECYPLERNLPVDPRTGEYVTVGGRPYEREPLGPEWVLDRFPPVLAGSSE